MQFRGDYRIASLDGIESIGVDEVQWKMGSQIPNVGLPNRRRVQASAVDRSGSNGQDTASLLSFLGQATQCEIAVCLQRHVAGLLESDRQEGASCASCTGSISCDAEDEQSDRQSACRGGEATEGGWLRAVAHRKPLVAAEATGEPERKASGEAQRTACSTT